MGDAVGPSADVLVLTFAGGNLAGQTFEFLGPRRVSLGRSKENDIEVFDPGVSRQHCAIVFDGQKVEIKDLGSANGTYVNGAAVRLAVASPGDLLRLAETPIRIDVKVPDDTVKQARVERPPSTEERPTLRDRNLQIELPGHRIAGLLGEGATSAVFKARRESDGELVAIKVLKNSESLGAPDRERFLREADTAARLDHPNIVRVLSRGEVAGRLYTIMELVRGETVRARLARLGPMPLEVALHVTRQIASALEYARCRGVVHRDVKPDNILLQEDGVAKLADFGLAKSLGDTGVPDLTQAGDLLGTLAYMSPEQLESSVSADHRSDIYSLGATLYHMIAGATPFSAHTSVDYFQKILRHEPPSLATASRPVPPIVCAMVAKCLRKRPEERYATAASIVKLTAQLLASAEQRQTAS